MNRKLFAALGIAAIALLGLGGVPAAAANLLVFHGGSVQTGLIRTHAIYWGSSFGPNYKTFINTYLTNVAADSGKTTNVYNAATQYYGWTGGVLTNASYNQQFAGAWTDTTYPAYSGCGISTFTPFCVTDLQVQQEVTKAILANGWSAGLHDQYFIFLGSEFNACHTSAVGDCALPPPDGDCFLVTGCFYIPQMFCTYHSHYGSGNGTILYANLPYHLDYCDLDNYPNSQPYAEKTVNLLSQAANGMITDPLGTGWLDAYGQEGGDKCAESFGYPLGGTSGNYYNQRINGAHYWLQQEWSNVSNQCVSSDK